MSGAMLACAGMALIFTFAIAWAMYHGLRISCGCFAGGGPIGYWTLIRAIAIFIVCTLAYVIEVFGLQQPQDLLRRGSGSLGKMPPMGTGATGQECQVLSTPIPLDD